MRPAAGARDRHKAGASDDRPCAMSQSNRRGRWRPAPAVESAADGPARRNSPTWRQSRARPRSRRFEHAAGPCRLIPFEHKKAEPLCIGRRGTLCSRVVLPESCPPSRSLSRRSAIGRKAGGNLAEAIRRSEKKQKEHVLVTLFLASMFSLVAETSHAATIKVMCDSPLEPALTKVADLFRQATNNEVGLACNAEPAIKKRIEDGEVADVVVVEPDFVEELTNSGKVRAGDRPIVGHVGVGLGNRTDGPGYDVSTIEKLKNTLLDADLIVFNSVKSGNAFAAVLQRLGIAEAVRPKIVRTAPLDIFDPVLKGKGNDIAAGTIPLIVTTPGIKLLGPLPADLQSSIPYTAALMTSALQPMTAEGFIKFLETPKAKETFAANGVTEK